MRVDVGLRQVPKVEMIASGGVEHASDDNRDDTTGSERLIDLHSKNGTAVMMIENNESKPLFRIIPPKVEYAASCPYYDILLYSFTPEEVQKQKLSTRYGSSRTTKQLITSSVDKDINVKTPSMNATKMDPNLVRDHIQQTDISLPTNLQDKIGDGDQTPIYDTYLHQVYLDLFRTGTCV